MNIDLNKQEIEATLALFDIAIKAVGLSQHAANAMALASKISAASRAEDEKPTNPARPKRAVS